MTTGRWVVAGLISAVLLVGLGYLLGTSSDSEIARFRQESRALADSALAARASRDSALALARGDSVRRVAAEEEARQAGDQSRDARRRAETARQAARSASLALDSARTDLDSLALYPPLVASLRSTVAALDSVVQAETARGDALQRGLTAEVAASGRLRRVVVDQEETIDRLVQQLRDAPRPPRTIGLRVLGVTLRPAVTVGRDVASGETRVVAGVSLSP